MPQESTNVALLDRTAYINIAPKVNNANRKLLDWLIDYREDAGAICCYGARGMGSTLLNHSGAGTDSPPIPEVRVIDPREVAL